VQCDNPLLFFLDLHPNRDQLIASHFPQLQDMPAQFTDEERDAIIEILEPRKMAPTPTDPSATNKTRGVEGKTGPTWFDPGRIEGSQLSYPLCKHEGPFAQFFLMIVLGKYGINPPGDEGAGEVLHFTVPDKAWNLLTEIHKEPSVRERLTSNDIGAKLLEDKPFFLPVLAFFGWRQFGSDLVYRTTHNDRRADLVLFTLGMNYMKAVFKTIIRDITGHLGSKSLHEAFQDPKYFQEFSHISKEAFEQCDTLNPVRFLPNISPHSAINALSDRS